MNLITDNTYNNEKRVAKRLKTLYQNMEIGLINRLREQKFETLYWTSGVDGGDWSFRSELDESEKLRICEE